MLGAFLASPVGFSIFPVQGKWLMCVLQSEGQVSGDSCLSDGCSWILFSLGEGRSVLQLRVPVALNTVLSLWDRTWRIPFGVSMSGMPCLSVRLPNLRLPV